MFRSLLRPVCWFFKHNWTQNMPDAARDLRRICLRCNKVEKWVIRQQEWV